MVHESVYAGTRLMDDIRSGFPTRRMHAALDWGAAARLALVLPVILWSAIFAQTESASEPQAEPGVPREVEVEHITDDARIADRLVGIFAATEWFQEPRVEVDRGVVFLYGGTHREQHRDWAQQLAGRTEGVVAVVNKIDLIEPDPWDLSSTWGEVRELYRGFTRRLPLLGLGLLMLLVAFAAAVGTAKLLRASLKERMRNVLMLGVLAKVVGTMVFLIGLYIVLRVSGLTQLAVTVVGGTGVAGLILGIAFRDIAENFLASLLISVQRPFRTGDLIEVEGQRGFVQKVTARGTVLMAFDGNYIQIPNSTIYKSTIRNITANPKTRLDFVVGIGYDTPIAMAQEVGMAVLREHPAVYKDPGPMVLAERMGPAAVDLRVYFWVDSTQISSPRVLSSVIRLVKRAYQQAGISLPDESREVIFPSGVPVRMIDASAAPVEGAPARPPELAQPDSRATSTDAEGDLAAEAQGLDSLARNSRTPEEGRNVLA